jgi:sulfur carrier protein
VHVLANGAKTELADGATLEDLLETLGLKAKWVVAEHNGEAVGRADMPRVVLGDGDRVELVRAVAGG